MRGYKLKVLPKYFIDVQKKAFELGCAWPYGNREIQTCPLFAFIFVCLDFGTITGATFLKDYANKDLEPITVKKFIEL